MTTSVKSLVAALIFFATHCVQAATVNFRDGIFDMPPWSSLTISGAVDGQLSARELSGGNPASFLNVITLTNAPTETAHINETFVYDPSEGAIESLDVSLDFRNINSFGQGHGVSAVLAMQDGNVFVSASFITGSSDFTWQTFSADGLTAENFALVMGSGQLDFESSGAPITFGFRTGNSGGSGINVGYDNYRVTLHTVPVPAALPLLLGALASLGWRRKH